MAKACRDLGVYIVAYACLNLALDLGYHGDQIHNCSLGIKWSMGERRLKKKGEKGVNGGCCG